MKGTNAGSRLLFLFPILFITAFSVDAQMITGVWHGRIDRQKVELKIIQKGDSLTGTSYYYESGSNYRRYSIKGYFDQRTNEVVWWDDKLIEEKSGRLSLSIPGKVPMLSSADFNCPGGGRMMLDGKAEAKTDDSNKKGDVHLDKTGRSEFEDEWDVVIDNYTVGGNDPDVIDSVAAIAFPAPYIMAPAGKPSAPETKTDVVITSPGKPATPDAVAPGIMAPPAPEKKPAMVNPPPVVAEKKPVRIDPPLVEEKKQEAINPPATSAEKKPETINPPVPVVEKKPEPVITTPAVVENKPEPIKTDPPRIDKTPEPVKQGPPIAAKPEPVSTEPIVVEKKIEPVKQGPPIDFERKPGPPVLAVEKQKPPVTPPPSIQEKFVKREKRFIKEIPVTGDSIEIRFYDNAEVDGDSISLFLDGKLIFEHVRLSAVPYIVKLAVSDIRDNSELVMVAENLGSIPPNTSYMAAYVNDEKHDAFLSSTEGSSALIRLRKLTKSP